MVLSVNVGCKASVQGEANSSGRTKAEAEAEAFGELGEKGIEGDTINDFAIEPAESGGDGALLGARHDVFIKGAQPQACKCLSVVAGEPGDPRIGWESKPAELNPATQLVVAFKSLPCSGATDDDLGAAYRGYKKSDKNVIVMIEQAKVGRPAISGALVPKPRSGGKLFIEPVPSTLPWGHPSDGAPGLCSVAF
jgi:hypothetical protein